MQVYGLTGGIGSGKSTVAEILQEYGIPVISADELSRIVVAPGTEGLRAVVQALGTEVLLRSGELDRRRVGSIVFADASKRRRLEEILHPLIRERYEQLLDAMEKAGHDIVVYEVPLLFEKDLKEELHAVILVTAEDRHRIERVRSRDTLSEAEVRSRMASQLDEATKIKRADYVVYNNGSLDDLRREVEFMFKRFLRASPTAPRAEVKGVPRATVAPQASPPPPPTAAPQASPPPPPPTPPPLPASKSAPTGASALPRLPSPVRAPEYDAPAPGRPDAPTRPEPAATAPTLISTPPPLPTPSPGGSTEAEPAT